MQGDARSEQDLIDITERKLRRQWHIAWQTRIADDHRPGSGGAQLGEIVAAGDGDRDGLIG